PAHREKTLERLRRWRTMCPDLAIRSTFVVGFPGESEEDFSCLLDWIAEARLARAGCFRYEAVDGAAANALPGAVPEAVKEERWHRFMAAQQKVSRAVLAERVGHTIQVLIDRTTEDGAVGRSSWDAPEIDGQVHLPGTSNVQAGDLIAARVARAGDYDLWAVPAA
ncbi:MAG: 30S ribosomal protein S12 methylthiotransferase RimO, partial [Hyphomicrobiaceae bacterium]